MLSSFARAVRLRLRLARVHPNLFTSIDLLLFAADRLEAAQRSLLTLGHEYSLLRVKVEAATTTAKWLHERYADAEIQRREAETLIGQLTGEVEILRGIVDGEASGLSTRIAEAVRSMSVILETGDHDHECPTDH